MSGGEPGGPKMQPGVGAGGLRGVKRLARALHARSKYAIVMPILVGIECALSTSVPSMGVALGIVV